jgi:hypothetical protein
VHDRFAEAQSQLPDQPPPRGHRRQHRRGPELTATGAYDAAATDLNGDGTKDIAVANSSANRVDIFTASAG